MDTPGYRIRPALATDIPALQDIEIASFPSDRLSRRQMRYHLTNLRALFLTCVHGDAPVGYALFFRRKKAPARLYSLVIDKNHRGKHLSAQLFEAALTTLRKEGYQAITLEVRKADKKTVSLYERWGFTVKQVSPNYYEDGGDALKMLKVVL